MRYQWGSSVETVEMDGEWVVLNAEQFTVAKLNEVGGFIWSKLKEPASQSDIVEHVLREYDVIQESAERDVAQFLGMLVEKNVLEVID